MISASANGRVGTSFLITVWWCPELGHLTTDHASGMARLKFKIHIPSCMSSTDFMERHVSQEWAVVSTQPCDRHWQKYYLINITTLVVPGNSVKCKLMCFVWMYVLARVWMFTYRPEITLNITPQELSTLFRDRVSHCSGAHKKRQGWMAREHQQSDYLHLPGTGIVAVYHCAQL